jgi:glycosyltransferase involved in cell wall biosynthesis
MRRKRPAVELVGYLGSAVGVGEGARRYLEALRRVGVPVLAHDVPLPGRDPARSPAPPGDPPSEDSIGFNLLCLNPEQMVPFIDSPDAPPQASRRTVGIWSWEVDIVPAGWVEAAHRVDELWTYSGFAARLIGSAVGRRVRSFPPPLASNAARTVPSDPGVGELPDGFRVLCMVDFLSTLERKNPIGAIEAFKQAFRPGEGPCLIVKTINGAHRPEPLAAVTDAASGRHDVVIIDRAISGSQRDALIAATDCFLSLHRSEGLGLPLAEAMVSGKPVIATGYGGNLEFMDERNSYLVDWRTTAVGAGVEHYPQGACWAEPNIDHAAALLRSVYKDQAGAAERAARGRRSAIEKLAPEVIGNRIKKRLTQLDPSGPRRFLQRQRSRGGRFA